MFFFDTADPVSRNNPVILVGSLALGSIASYNHRLTPHPNPSTSRVHHKKSTFERLVISVQRVCRMLGVYMYVYIYVHLRYACIHVYV